MVHKPVITSGEINEEVLRRKMVAMKTLWLNLVWYKRIAILLVLTFIATFCIVNNSKTNVEKTLKAQINISTSSEKEYWTNYIAKQPMLNEDLLIDVVRNVFVDWSPTRDMEYHFDKNPPKLTGQIGMPVIVDKLLGEKQNGFFIEAGALDGEAHSNTLLFELQRNYTGLLIEPSLYYPKMLARKRKVASVNACLSTKRIPHVVEFLSYKGIGGIKGEVKGWASNDVKANAEVLQALCLPFISILYAIGSPSVDYFSLDIEGVELDVLKTIPWDKVDIKIFSIEVVGNGREAYGEKVDKVMLAAGYTKILNLCCDEIKLDNVYVRNDFRSPLFKYDGRPRLMQSKNNAIIEI